MTNPIVVFTSGLFILAATCYLILLVSKPLEETGGRLGYLLRVPEEVIASTFQALATSGPEIVIAVQAIHFKTSEKACSGLLNMGFSAMSNLVGIGCLGMIYMIWKGDIDKNEAVELSHSVKNGLFFYIVSSTCLSLFITFDFNMGVLESWVLMIIGIVFLFSQYYLSGKHKETDKKEGAKKQIESDEKVEKPFPDTVRKYAAELTSNGFIYAFCVFGLWILVRECLEATFMMASVGIASIAGVLIMFTSYVSSFPEFMMAYRYAAKGKKEALLGMLFGSNVIDLAFAGFRPIWTGEPMEIVAGKLLPIYICLLPITAYGIYKAASKKKMKYKHAYPLMAGYIVYIVSGFILL